MPILLVSTFDQISKIPDGYWFVFDRGFKGTFRDEDLHRELKTKPYLVCLKIGTGDYKFRAFKEAGTSEEAKQLVEEYLHRE